MLSDSKSHRKINIPSHTLNLQMKQVTQKLESLWSAANKLDHSQYFGHTHELLYQLLNLIESYKFSKPDWKSIFYQNLIASINTKCKAIVFYYFRLASKLSTRLCLPHLIDLLRQQRDYNVLTSSSRLNIDQLKINYNISCRNKKQFEKYFHFLQKLTVKQCMFILEINEQINCQQLFVYYFSIVETNAEAIHRFRKIATTAFGAYCYYFYVKKIQLKLNIFKIILKIIQFWKKEVEEFKDLQFCCKNYIILLTTPQVVQFISQFGSSLNVYQDMAEFLRFIISKSEQSRNSLFSQLMQEVCLRLISSKSTRSYLDFSGKIAIETDKESQWPLMMKIMQVHSEIKKFNTFNTFEFYNKWLISADQSLKSLKDRVSPQFFKKLISMFFLDISKYLINEVRLVFERKDPTNLLKYERQDFNLFINFLPLYRFLTDSLFNQVQKSNQLVSIFYMKIFIGLLSICLIQSNQNAQNTLIRFITDEHSQVLSTNHQKQDLLKILVTLNRLASTRYCQLAFRAITAYINSNVSFHVLLNEPQAQNLFAVLRRKFKQKCDKCKDETCKSCNQSNVFTAKIIELLFKKIISLFHFQKNQKLNDLQSQLLHQMIEILVQNYGGIEDDGSAEIVSLLIKYTQRQQKLDYVLNIIKNYVFELSYQNFLQASYKKNSISNGITLYRNILSQKVQNNRHMSQIQKIELIDFMANIKRILSYCTKLSIQIQKKDVQYCQDLIGECENIERVFLGQSPSEYIQDLFLNIKYRVSVSFQILTSICLKSIYYIIYPPKNALQPAQPQIYNNIEATSSVEEMPPKNQYDFLHGQLEQMSIKLKTIKNKLKLMQSLFKNSVEKSETYVVSTSFKKYTIKLQSPNYIHHVIWQLNDLFYIAHLADMNSLKYLLISLRLSLIQDHYNRQILFLQLAKINLYELISPEQRLSTQKILQKQIKRLQHNECNLQYHFLLKLLTFGQSKLSYQGQFRLLKIIYLLKNNPLFYVNNKKNIVLYLFDHINSQMQNNQEIQSGSCLLRNSRILYRNFQFDLRQQSQILHNGWSCLQLMVLFSKKILKKCLQLNQLSKIGGFDKFSANLLIKSGNIAEMDVLFTVLSLKKKNIEWLKVADSLREVVSSQICENDYKKIDRILYPNRKSFLMSFKNTSKLIYSAFKSCGKIGFVLSDIFLLRIKKQFQVDQWECINTYYQVNQFSNKINSQFKEQIQDLTQNNERDLDEEIAFDIRLTRRIATRIFQSYRQATALKDYIARFINQAIDNPQALNSSQHRKLDNLISNLALIFEQFNYQIKQFWLRHQSPFNLQDSFQTLNRNKSTMLNDYTQMKKNYLGSIQHKKRQLQNSKYPVSFLFPLGKYLFNMAWKGGLLVTYVSLSQFEDNFNKVQDIIKKYDQILISKQKINPTTYKRRKELDKSMGFIVSSVDIGIIDQEQIDTSRFLPSYANQINELSRINKSLLKFLKIQREYSYKHLQLFATRYQIKDIQEIRMKIKRISEYLLKININQKSNILLYLHYNYLPFPFEGIRTLQDKGIFRIPSISYLLQNQHKKGQYRASELKFLINPGDDLAATEQKFQLIRRKYDQWIGLKKRKPMFPEFVHLLEKEIFLYMGHGTGTQQFSSKQLNELKINCLMMVFGCSSAKMIFQHSQPHGWAYESLMKGCPGYMGCLWNVTDVDMDLITTGIFSRQKSQNLSITISKQKQKCYYQNINGSSLVIYGLPSILIFK